MAGETSNISVAWKLIVIDAWILQGVAAAVDLCLIFFSFLCTR